ncbi:MAG: radical SAM protein [Candidatus Aenigmatarchaeota archaeon]
MFNAFYSLSLPFVGKIAQIFLKMSSGYCKKCKNDRIKIITEYFFNKNNNLCERCLVTAKFFSVLLNLGKNSLKVPLSDMEKYFGEEYVKKGLYALLKSAEFYGFQKPLKTVFPLLVVWNYTNNCNLKCKHCYQNAGKKSKELSTNQRKEVIDKLVDANVISLAFSGGEPLVEKDFFNVAKYAVKKGLYVAIATNGTLITPRIARKIKETGIEYVEISLDGSDAKTHDNFRGIHGLFKRTVNALRYCVNEGLVTCIATTVNKNNLNQIAKIKDLGEKIGVNRFVAFNFIPVGRGKENIKLDISPNEREEILKLLSNWLGKSKLEVVSTAPQFARVCIENFKMPVTSHFNAPLELFKSDTSILESFETLKFVAEFIGGCGAGRVYCAIQPNGDVTPCVYIPTKVGNILKDDLKDIWLNSNVLKILRFGKRKGNCGVCKYKNICGGCRARAFAYFNDYLAPDPGCIKNKEYWKSLSKF